MRYRERKEEVEAASKVTDGDVADKWRGHHEDEWETITLDLKTITPIYGGGVEAGQPDLMVPFRPRSIRNGIKHWWWMLHRHEYITANGYLDQTNLFEAMTDLWGRAADDEADAAAKVRVTVTPPPADCVKRAAFAPYRIDSVKRDGLEVQGPDGQALLKLTADAKHPYTYAIFGARGELSNKIPQDKLRALRDVCTNAYGGQTNYDFNGSRQAYFDRLAACTALWKEKEGPARLILPGAALTMSVAISKGIDESKKLQVIDAIKYWIMFGGIGARTSRGMGKLMLVGSKPISFKLPTNLTLPTGFCCGYQLKAFPSNESAMLALLQKYREFRQCRPAGLGKPGQSFWPKGDIVRHRTGKNDAGKHPPRWIMSGGAAPPATYAEAMPELLLGAPIIVSFDPTGRQKAALDFESNGQHLERYSSPLIFGFVPDHEGGLRAAALVLRIGVDFIALKPAARLNWNDSQGNQTCLVPYGEWWPAWETMAYKTEATVLTNNLRPASGFGAMTPLHAFLKYINL